MTNEDLESEELDRRISRLLLEKKEKKNAREERESERQKLCANLAEAFFNGSNSEALELENKIREFDKCIDLLNEEIDSISRDEEILSKKKAHLSKTRRPMPVHQSIANLTDLELNLSKMRKRTYELVIKKNSVNKLIKDSVDELERNRLKVELSALEDGLSEIRGETKYLSKLQGRLMSKGLSTGPRTTEIIRSFLQKILILGVIGMVVVPFIIGEPPLIAVIIAVILFFFEKPLAIWLLPVIAIALISWILKWTLNTKPSLVNEIGYSAFVLLISIVCLSYLLGLAAWILIRIGAISLTDLQ